MCMTWSQNHINSSANGKILPCVRAEGKEVVCGNELKGFLLKATWERWILSMFAERRFTASLLSERSLGFCSLFYSVCWFLHDAWSWVLTLVELERVSLAVKYLDSMLIIFWFHSFSHWAAKLFTCFIYIAKCLVTTTPQQWSPVDFLFAKQITSLSGKCTLCMQVTLSHLAITNDGCMTKAK